MDPLEHPCQHCGEPTMGQPYDEPSKPTCRDCDIGRLVASGTCRECLTWIIDPDNPVFEVGPVESQHKPGCSLATSYNYAPRTEAELVAVMESR